MTSPIPVKVGGAGTVTPPPEPPETPVPDTSGKVG